MGSPQYKDDSLERLLRKRQQQEYHRTYKENPRAHFHKTQMTTDENEESYDQKQLRVSLCIIKRPGENSVEYRLTHTYQEETRATRLQRSLEQC